MILFVFYVFLIYTIYCTLSIKLFIYNMNETIEFIENECTAEQFSWLSEIFDDIARASNSKAFIKAFRRTARKYPQTTEMYNIEHFINCAEEQIQ